MCLFYFHLEKQKKIWYFKNHTEWKSSNFLEELWKIK